MSRLTKKIELQSRLTDKIENHYIIECPNLFNYICGKNQLNEFLSTQDKGIQKLGKLEDIEEELGVDLTVYHRLMNMLYCGEPDNIYIKEGNNIVEVHILEIDYCKKKIIFYKDNYEDEYVYGFYQYGVDWSFVKADLENN